MHQQVIRSQSPRSGMRMRNTAPPPMRGSAELDPAVGERDGRDDRQAEPGATAVAGSGRISSVEAFEGPVGLIVLRVLAHGRRLRGRRRRPRSRPATRAGVPGGVWARTLASRLSTTWRSRSRSPRTSTDPSTSSSTVRSGSTARAASTASDADRSQIDRVTAQRTALVETGEQQKIVDEQTHASCFHLDARAAAGRGRRDADRRPIGTARRRPARRRPVCAARGKRRRRNGACAVRTPVPPPPIGGARSNATSMVSSMVLSAPTEPADLGGRRRLVDAVGEVATGDLSRRRLDVGQGAQTEPRPATTRGRRRPRRRRWSRAPRCRRVVAGSPACPSMEGRRRGSRRRADPEIRTR